MKEIGKVKEYNGYYGKIIDREGKEYLLLDNQIVGNEDIQQLDAVTFVPENYNNSEVNKDIARFVRKLEKKENGID